MPPKLTLSRLENLLMAACDILRGHMNALEVRDLTLGILFLKRLSDKFDEDKARILAVYEQQGTNRDELEKQINDPGKYDIYVPERARWDYIKHLNKGLGFFINKALAGLEEVNPGTLRDLFKGIDYNKQVGQKPLDDSKLIELIRHFGGIPLGDEDFEFPGMIGEAFEYLIKYFADSAGRKGIEFYSPAEVVELLVNVLEPKEGMSIYDPTVGSGGTLIQSKKYIESSGGDTTKTWFFGQELNGDTWSLCRMNMLLHGVINVDIRNGDTLNTPLHIENDGNLKRFDRVLACPPFSANFYTNGMLHKERFQIFMPENGKRGDYMFIQHMISVLKDNGRMATLVSNGALSRGGQEQEARKYLLQNGLIEAVIALPSGLFYATSIPACILIINKEGTHMRKHVLFINAERGYKAGSRNKLRPEDIEKVNFVYHNKHEEIDYSRMVKVEDLVADGYNLNVRRYVPSATTVQETINFTENTTQNMDNIFDISVNTIIYGPPGTGKTHRLNEYKERLFTDSGIKQDSDEALRDKLSEYSLWQVVAAVLSKSREATSVTELLNNSVIKAKLNPLAKAPRQSVWGVLQVYADDSSTELEAKYRGSLQLFKKDAKSKWSIVEDKKTELQDIVGQELIDVAANPAIPPVESTHLKKRYNFITFHQKYSYEDFIEGIKPLLKNDDVGQQIGTLQFELKKGVFYNSCLEALKLVGYESFKECYKDSKDNRNSKFEEASHNSSLQFALFIDEINRANISAVFGELITLLEEDKRIGAPNEMWIQLPYSNEMFCVPANLYVIGTMNTADRSIALLDIALRRRFEFKALYPEYIESEWWSPLLEKLNQAIYNWKKNPDFFIGHAFFIGRPEGERSKILNTRIIPLLYEYCQNNVSTITRILNEANIEIRMGDLKENFQITAL